MRDGLSSVAGVFVRVDALTVVRQIKSGRDEMKDSAVMVPAPTNVSFSFSPHYHANRQARLGCFHRQRVKEGLLYFLVNLLAHLSALGGSVFKLVI